MKRRASRLAALAKRVSGLAARFIFAVRVDLVGLAGLPSLAGLPGLPGLAGFANLAGFGGLIGLIGLALACVADSGAVGKPDAFGD